MNNGSKREHGHRSLGSHMHYIRSAGAVEAVAPGHPEADVDHLLLGLLATGGPSAQVLTGAGVGLAAVRRAVTEVQERDLGELGVTTVPQRPTIRAASRHVGLAVPVNGRAKDLLEGTPYRGDDRGLLLALLGDDGRRVLRLLERLGVDVTELRDRATRGRPPAAAAPPPEADWPGAALRGPAPAGTTWLEASCSQVLPVPPTGSGRWSATRSVVRRGTPPARQSPSSPTVPSGSPDPTVAW